MRNNSKFMLLAAMFTSLTALGAFIKIPIPPYPVPMSMQTAFVFLAGLLLTPRAAFFSQMTYVLLGLLGIPLFVGGGGIGYVLTPTFGYLLGFLLCAPLLSVLSQRTLFVGKRVLYYALVVVLALLLQLCGVGYMALLSAMHTGISLPLSKALYLIAVFLPLDLIKLVLASQFAGILKKRLPSLFATTTKIPQWHM